MVIKDKIMLGAIAGVLASIPQILLNALFVQLKLTEFYDFQISGSVYLYKYLTLTTSGFIFGGVMWEFIAVGLGIAASYVIAKTGKAHWWFKGILVSNLCMYALIYGFFFSLGAPSIVPWDLKTNWSMLLDNTVFGVTLGYFITVLAERKKIY